MLGFSLRAEISRFLADRSGATAIEYALIASGISIAIVTTVWNLGGTLRETFYDKLAEAVTAR